MKKSLLRVYVFVFLLGLLACRKETNVSFESKQILKVVALEGKFEGELIPFTLKVRGDSGNYIYLNDNYGSLTHLVDLPSGLQEFEITSDDYVGLKYQYEEMGEPSQGNTYHVIGLMPKRHNQKTHITFQCKLDGNYVTDPSQIRFVVKTFPSIVYNPINVLLGASDNLNIGFFQSIHTVTIDTVTAQFDRFNGGYLMLELPASKYGLATELYPLGFETQINNVTVRYSYGQGRGRAAFIGHIFKDSSYTMPLV